METKQNHQSLVIKHVNWVDTHPMIITAKYGYGTEKMQFNHFLIISL